ncbi:MAG: hypothetical protein AAF458_07730 [Pseudomonadota bacterium]
MPLYGADMTEAPHFGEIERQYASRSANLSATFDLDNQRPACTARGFMPD